jgi:cob(I)alamin adenosyltransferase
MQGAAHRGDGGETDLLGHQRVRKDDPVVEALGALDEATSALGVAKQAAQEPRTRRAIHQAQDDLYQLMADLASRPDTAPNARLTPEHVAWLDRGVAALQAAVPVPRRFVLPGGCAASAAVDYARAVVRTAERRLARLAHEGTTGNPHGLAYVNRLSLLLYYLARAEDAAAGVDLDLAGAPSAREEI